MRIPSRALVGILLLSTCLLALKPAAALRLVSDPAASQDGIAVFFSPRGGAAGAVVEQIGRAQTSIDVQAYSFTHAAIAKALVDAHKRGVKVRAVLDSSNRSDKYSAATFLHNAGVPVWIDDVHAIAHNKLILIDGGEVIVTGSMNSTKAGEERNAENLLIIQRQADLGEAYRLNLEQHLAHSQRYERP